MKGGLSEIIVALWDRTQRVFPKYTPRRLTRWLLAGRDDLAQEDSLESAASVYPAYWADDESFDPNKNVLWGGGAWA